MLRPRSVLKGRYRIVRQLGEGGMAIVFEGHDVQLGRDVAIKTLRPQFAADPSFRARFEREARAAASLSHPNIIDVYDVGEEKGTPFLVMELVRGQTLKAIIAAEAPFHPDDVAALLEQIAAALDYAHSRGYVHRDIKPGNILIDEHGRARLVDFGIAKGLSDPDLTTSGAGFGTAAYIAPEQAEGLMATPASDVYSIGVVAFEMLTGQLPFRAESPVGVAIQHINDPPPAPSHVQDTVPSEVDEIVLRSLEKDPTRRWASAGAFALALRRPQPKTVPSFKSPSGGRVVTRSSSSLWPTAVAIALVVGALAALLWIGMRALPSIGPVPQTLGPILVEPTITGAIDVQSATEQPRATESPAPTEQIESIVSATESEPPTIAPIAEQAEPVVVVPNLQGLTIAGSTEALLPLGLRIALGQPAFSDSIPFNAVVSQDPPPGSAVAPDTVVRVSLSRGPSPFLDGNEP